jgi:hypothetical protein
MVGFRKSIMAATLLVLSSAFAFAQQGTPAASTAPAAPASTAAPAPQSTAPGPVAKPHKGVRARVQTRRLRRLERRSKRMLRRRARIEKRASKSSATPASGNPDSSSPAK